MVFNGKGDFAASRFWVCIDCGKTEPVREGLPPLMLVAPQPLLDERRQEMH
jgi:hypothetical protein